MAAEHLHSALQNLSPTTWSQVPQSALAPYLTDIFTSAELLVNSVPPPPNGTPFDTARPQFSSPNAAKSAADIHSSSARTSPPDPAHADLQKHWGKAMKFSQKENPLNVALYKMAGHDRHGAWFARHQVMEGIGFAKFAAALRREFPETLLVQGAPGAGAKRGLSGERRVERIDADGVGRVEVYQLSAQMPSPVSPRDFLTLLLSTEKGLTGKSAADGADGGKHVPRSFMVISRPLDHPDAPARSSFVRGQYESVELIREVPLHVSKSTVDLNKEAEGDTVDPELNPVEWIMITRSDPSGGVPRFLVDRGTPGAMLTDVTKFLNWACAFEEVPDADSDLSLQLQKSREMAEKIRGQTAGMDTSIVETAAEKEHSEEPDETPVDSAATPTQASTVPTTTNETEATTSQPPTGLVGNVGQAVISSVDAYAPSTVANFMHRQLGDDDGDLSDSSESSLDSFLSAEELRRMSTAPEPPESPETSDRNSLPRESTENISVTSAASSTTSKRNNANLSQHDKDLLKLSRQREKLDAKLAKKREVEQEKLKSSAEKEESEQTKARERMEREMKKTEERHRKEMEKLEAKRLKQEGKQVERRRKREDVEKLGAVVRERDEFRREAELLRRETTLLREQVEGLQKENTSLVAQMGRVRAATMDGGGIGEKGT